MTAAMPRDGNGAPIQVLRPVTGAGVTVTFSGTGAATAAFSKDTVVRLHPTEDCHIHISVDPATDVATTSMLMPADSVEYFSVPSGMKVGALQNVTGGTLYVTEME